MAVDDADRPEIDHDTKGEKGMADIPSTILNKIANAAVFVANLTPIVRTDLGKWVPNPNVMIELGWAMHRPGWERVIGILNTASGTQREDLPFDIRQRRIVTFVLNDNADAQTKTSVRKKLVEELTEALRANLAKRAERIAEKTTINGIAANANNRSIWASARDILVHNDAFNGSRKESVGIPDVPRSYLRIIPSGWTSGVPSISDIARRDNNKIVDAPHDGASAGDYGATNEGFVRYWITGPTNSPQSAGNMSMFFEETGEFWILHGSIIISDSDHYLLKDQMMLGAWSRGLRTAMRVMDDFGAKKLRLAEAGLFGADNVRWFSEWKSDRSHSRRNETFEVRQDRDWGIDARLTFLTSAYNRVRNLFALNRLSEAEISEFFSTLILVA